MTFLILNVVEDFGGQTKDGGVHNLGKENLDNLGVHRKKKFCIVSGYRELHCTW